MTGRRMLAAGVAIGLLAGTVAWAAAQPPVSPVVLRRTSAQEHWKVGDVLRAPTGHIESPGAIAAIDGHTVLVGDGSGRISRVAIDTGAVTPVAGRSVGGTQVRSVASTTKDFAVATDQLQINAASVGVGRAGAMYFGSGEQIWKVDGDEVHLVDPDAKGSTLTTYAGNAYWQGRTTEHRALMAITTGEPTTLDAALPIDAAALSAYEGGVLAVAFDLHDVWRILPGSPGLLLRVDEAVTGFAALAGGGFATITGDDDLVRFHDPQGKVVGTATIHKATALAALGDGSVAVTSSDADEVYSVRPGSVRAVLPPSERFRTADIDAQGRVVTVTESGDVMIWDHGAPRRVTGPSDLRVRNARWGRRGTLWLRACPEGDVIGCEAGVVVSHSYRRVLGPGDRLPQGRAVESVERLAVDRGSGLAVFATNGSHLVYLLDASGRMTKVAGVSPRRGPSSSADDIVGRGRVGAVSTLNLIGNTVYFSSTPSTLVWSMRLGSSCLHFRRCAPAPEPVMRTAGTVFAIVAVPGAICAVQDTYPAAMRCQGRRGEAWDFFGRSTAAPFSLDVTPGDGVAKLRIAAPRVGFAGAQGVIATNDLGGALFTIAMDKR